MNWKHSSECDELSSSKSNFQLSVVNNASLFWPCFILLCDWSRKLASLPQLIRFELETNRDLCTPVFARFRQLACFYFEFSSAHRDIFLPLIGRKLALLSRPIRFKTKTNRKLFTPVFPRFRQLACFYLEFSLAPRDIFLALIGCCDFFGYGLTKLNRKALWSNVIFVITDVLNAYKEKYYTGCSQKRRQ